MNERVQQLDILNGPWGWVQWDEDAYADPERAQQLRVEGNDLFKAGKTHDAREAYSEAIYLMSAKDKKELPLLDLLNLCGPTYIII